MNQRLVVAVHDNLPFLKWLETQLSQIFHQSGPATERKVPMMRTAEKNDFRNRYFGAPPGAAVSLNKRVSGTQISWSYQFYPILDYLVGKKKYIDQIITLEKYILDYLVII